MDRDTRRLVTVFGAISVFGIGFEAVGNAWPEHHFVAALAEELVAQTLYWAGLLGGAGAGIVAGVTLFRRIPLRWLAWGVALTAGAALVVASWRATDWVASQIPGVDWRYSRHAGFGSGD